MHILRIKTLIGLLFILSCTAVKSQQFPIYSQYIMNAFLLNPAIAGHEGYTSVNLTVREQWVGVKDAPSTYAISGQTRLLKNSFIARSKSIRRRRRVMSRSGKVGLGGYVFSDQSGIFTRNGFSGTYSYHLALKRSQLSFGLALKGFQYKIDQSKINDPDYGKDDYYEPAVYDKSENLIADFDFGSYYSDKNLIAGFSIQNLFESIIRFKGYEGSQFRLERHYLVLAGYRYDIIDFVFTEPSVLFKLSEAGIAQLDANLRFYIKEDYWGGISYRTGSGKRISDESMNGMGSSLIFMGGARVDKFYLGYSFGYNFSSIAKETLGSHEILLSMKFGDSARRYRWLNRY